VEGPNSLSGPAMADLRDGFERIPLMLRARDILQRARRLIHCQSPSRLAPTRRDIRRHHEVSWAGDARDVIDKQTAPSPLTTNLCYSILGLSIKLECLRVGTENIGS